MAYFKTLKNGTRRLILTARDRQIQNDRRANRFAQSPKGGITPYRRDRFSQDEIEALWRWFEYDVERMEAFLAKHQRRIDVVRARLQLTRLDNHGADWEPRTVNGWNVEPTVGYIEGVIEALDHLIIEQKRYEQAVRVFRAANRRQ